MRLIEPDMLSFGKPLPVDLFDARGELFMKAGDIVERIDLTLASERLREGLFAERWPVAKAKPDNEKQTDDNTSAADQTKPSPSPANTVTIYNDQTIDVVDDQSTIQVADTPDEDARKAGAANEKMAVRSFGVGDVLDADIEDEQGILLLRNGSTITERFLKQLKRRNIRYVRKRAASQEASATSPAGGSAADRPAVKTEPKTTSEQKVKQWLENQDRIDAPRPRPAAEEGRLPLEALRSELRACRERYTTAVDYYADLSQEVIKGRQLAAWAADEVVTSLSQALCLDPSLALLSIDLQSKMPDYLYNHGLNVALVAMRVAQYLGYDESQVKDVGVGSLFQDLGMLRVSEQIRMAPRPLSPSERFEVERHPIHTLNLLEQMSKVTRTALIVAYQAHERQDGSGYPCKRPNAYIHPLAKIVNVADTYTAITSPRPHREGALPYEGMTILLKEAKAGKLDRQVVRAFVDCLSLFPIGSYVKLSNGTVAKVLRNNGGEHTRPVVVPLNPDGSETDEELDLGRNRTLSVVEAIRGPRFAQPHKVA